MTTFTAFNGATAVIECERFEDLCDMPMMKMLKHPGISCPWINRHSHSSPSAAAIGRLRRVVKRRRIGRMPSLRH
ncbi:Uncharacterized protein pbN1_35820 [Aromatoleum bremense]|nr:Uncharacterized protein pbN1_35820 [Aromatoleum bremense]